MARNRKEAGVTGGGSPSLQEELDDLEERVAAVIPEELVVGVPGQDSAEHEEPQDTQEHGTHPHEQEPMFESDDDAVESVPSVDTDVIQDLLLSIQTPSPRPRRQTSTVGSPLAQPGSTPTPPPTTSLPHHSPNTLNIFEQRVVDVQGQLAQEVRKGIESMAGTLEGVLRCLTSNSGNAETGSTNDAPPRTLFHAMNEISEVMQQRHRQMPNTSGSLEVARHP
ncbi:uncharacterized protein LOC144751950 [Lissotriton helveticus]